MGNKAMSHDSVFVSDSPLSENNDALGASQDSIDGKVKSLQARLFFTVIESMAIKSNMLTHARHNYVYLSKPLMHLFGVTSYIFNSHIIGK